MIGRRKPQVPDGCTSATEREIKRLYTPVERTTLTRAYEAKQAGDAEGAEAIAKEVDAGLLDARFVVERIRPSYTPEQGFAAVRAETALATEDYDGVYEIFDEAGLDIDDFLIIKRIGMLAHYRILAREMAAPEPEYVPEPEPEVVPEAESQSDPVRVRTLTLPDGTDHRDPEVQRRVESKVRQAYGPHWVVMWPRNPDVEDGIDPIFALVNARPYEEHRPFGTSATASSGSMVAATGARVDYGVLVDYHDANRMQIFARLDEETVELRNRFARVLSCREHEIEIALHHVIDKHTSKRRLDQVVITRAPVKSTDPEKRKQTWANLVANIPGGSTGWGVVEDSVGLVTRLRHGQPRTLPAEVPMIDLLPDDYSPHRWAQIPFGKDPEGRVAHIDMDLGPHVLLVGPSGTGKTFAMLQIAMGALTAGYQVIVVDAAKRGADYKRIKPWTSAWARSYAEAGAVMKAVYAESQRRADLIDAYDEDHWSRLPADVLERENIAPVLVLIDEYQAFNEIVKPSAGLDKDGSEYAEIMAENEAKAAVVTATRRLVAEARWAGIYVCLGTQRAPADTVPVTMRDNVHWKIQLVPPGKPMSPSTLGLTFPSEQANEAGEVKIELDDGQSRGLALVGGDGGSVIGVRVGKADKPALAGILEEFDVPIPEQWEIQIDAPPEVPGSRIGGKPMPKNLWGNKPTPAPATPAPVVVDLEEFAVALDDLEPALDDLDIETPTVARRPAVTSEDDLWS